MATRIASSVGPRKRAEDAEGLKPSDDAEQCEHERQPGAAGNELRSHEVVGDEDRRRANREEDGRRRSRTDRKEIQDDERENQHRAERHHPSTPVARPTAAGCGTSATMQASVS